MVAHNNYSHERHKFCQTLRKANTNANNALVLYGKTSCD